MTDGDDDWCALRHPASGAPLTRLGRPLRVRLVPPGGRAFRAALHRRRDDDAGLLAAITLDWEAFVAADGTALACDAATAAGVYRTRPWLCAQLAEFAAARAAALTRRLEDLADHARHRFRLARRQADGAALGEHLAAYAARTGRAHPLLAGPELPAEAAHLWGWFAELHACRAPGRPLGHAEIAAWARLTGERPEPWELAGLRLLDRTWMTEE